MTAKYAVTIHGDRSELFTNRRKSWSRFRDLSRQGRSVSHIDLTIARKRTI